MFDDAVSKVVNEVGLGESIRIPIYLHRLWPLLYLGFYKEILTFDHDILLASVRCDLHDTGTGCVVSAVFALSREQVASRRFAAVTSIS